MKIIITELDHPDAGILTQQRFWQFHKMPKMTMSLDNWGTNYKTANLSTCISTTAKRNQWQKFNNKDSATTSVWNKKTMPQSLESSFTNPGQLHIYIKIRGYVSNDLSGGISIRRKIARMKIFLCVKLEWIEWMRHFSCSLCSMNCSYKHKTAVFCWNFCASVVPPSHKGLWERICIFLAN